MKKIFAIILTCLTLSAAAATENNIVNVYNWSDYMPSSVIDQFQKETGIKVNYSEYDSNETMYAKLKTEPTPSYDVIVPSDYFVDKMRKQGMLQKIDKSQLSNFKNLNTALLNRPYDPENNYSVPYLWGTVGIALNKQYFKPDSIVSWNDLWQPQYNNKLLMLDDMRMVFSIALISLGYSINDTNPDHIKQAYEKLQQLMPNIKLFNSDSADNLFIDDDVTIGINYSGDTYRDSLENPNLVYVYPKEGFMVWIDSMAIPKGAPHLANAYKFINFLLRPDIAKEIALSQEYSSPNKVAESMMPESRKINPILNPSPEILKRAQSSLDLGDADAIYAKYWEMLKIGG